MHSDNVAVRTQNVKIDFRDCLFVNNIDTTGLFAESSVVALNRTIFAYEFKIINLFMQWTNIEQ